MRAGALRSWRDDLPGGHPALRCVPARVRLPVARQPVRAAAEAAAVGSRRARVRLARVDRFGGTGGDLIAVRRDRGLLAHEQAVAVHELPGCVADAAIALTKPLAAVGAAEPLVVRCEERSDV